MRWWVEVTPLWGDGAATEIVVEAEEGRAALSEVRRQRHETGSLGLEILGAGLRAIDLDGGRRYIALPESTQAAEAVSEGRHERGSRMPAYEIVVARDFEPTRKLPLSYRERGVSIAAPVTEQAASELLSRLLDQQREALSGRPPGQVIELAIFVGRVDPRKLPVPWATLSYKDWRPEAELWLSRE